MPIISLLENWVLITQMISGQFFKIRLLDISTLLGYILRQVMADDWVQATKEQFCITQWCSHDSKVSTHQIHFNIDNCFLFLEHQPLSSIFFVRLIHFYFPTRKIKSTSTLLMGNKISEIKLKLKLNLIMKVHVTLYFWAKGYK